MDLQPYIAQLRDQLAVAAEAGGDDARALAERLIAPLESSARLALLDALSGAAEEITRELAPGSVEVRLRGRDPEFVVSTPPPEQPVEATSGPVDVAWRAGSEGDDAAMTRINVRLAQDLKDRVEDAARQAGISANAWLVRSAVLALTADASRTTPAPVRGGDRYSGWVR